MERVALESVTVLDWRDYGPAYVVQTEDGPRVRLPESAPIVLAVTRRGYKYSQGFASWEEARARAARVVAVGSINPDKWVDQGICYGSEAYQDLDAVGFWQAQERAEEGR